MKIDNYAMDLQTQTFESRSTSTTFKDELLTLNNEKVKEINSIGEELEFMKKLQYDLINQLLGVLSENTQSNNYKPSQTVEEELKSFEQENFLFRKISYESITTRTQSLDVSMKGFVQSGDKQIELNMDLSFSSKYVEKFSLEATVFHDPLVINYDTDIPELDDLNFSFDIDMDGDEDQISMLKKGSGFLALDKDENGKIDDGYELFGTQNGNGFADLARYDKDGNNWIDENDEIFDKLRIWSKNGEEDTLFGLGEKGVGAIYLGNTEGEFDLMANDEIGARVRSNGLFLNEDGTSGLMTQIDFAKHKNKTEEKTSPLGELLKA